jgi:hypothetical protein
MDTNTKPAQTTQGGLEQAAAFETQARLCYRMGRSEWACLSDLAFMVLMTAFADRVRVAAGLTIDVWESMQM